MTMRAFSAEQKKVYGIHAHDGTEYLKDEKSGDHVGRQQNHIWSAEEIDSELKSLYRHKPVTIADKFMNFVMSTLFHSFNFITGYKEGNATVKSIEWRLIVLESVAGVPGFVAAGFRHFRSLRRLQRDHGWIATLLEEAENERMHLFVCLKMFEASRITRAAVIAAQFTLAPTLMLVYLVHPRSMHRFVGYLEETACHTYASIIEQVQRPGTPLHEGWKDLAAPETAIAYWKLPKDAKWVDALKCMFADECHHRDVNHTFAELTPTEPNPFVLKHKRDALYAMVLEKEGRTAWPSAEEIANARIDKAIPAAQQAKK